MGSDCRRFVRCGGVSPSTPALRPLSAKLFDEIERPLLRLVRLPLRALYCFAQAARVLRFLVPARPHAVRLAQIAELQTGEGAP